MYGKHQKNFFVSCRPIFCWYSVQFLFEVLVYFPSVSNLFYICSMFLISLHVAVWFLQLIKEGTCKPGVHVQ